MLSDELLQGGSRVLGEGGTEGHELLILRSLVEDVLDVLSFRS